jgi:excisionase family DNA binding protein
MTEDDPLIRPSVAARRLGVCTETLRRWIRKGALPVERVGPGRVQRVRESEVEKLRDVPRATTTGNKTRQVDTSI